MKNYLIVIIGILIITLFILEFQYPGDEVDESIRRKYDYITVFLIVMLTLAVGALFWFDKYASKKVTLKSKKMKKLLNKYD